MSNSSDVIVVPVEHPAFAGHFPARPILPGAVLLDWIVRSITKQMERPLRLAGIPVVKFLQPVSPGAILALSWQLDRTSGFARFSAALQDGPQVIEGTLSFESESLP